MLPLRLWATVVSSASLRRCRPDVRLCHCPDTSATLAIGPTRYFDLRQNRTNDYKFSYKHMLARNGDTAGYMQYAHARIASIARKAGVDPASLNPNLLNLEHQAEADLAFHITRFQEVVASIEDDLMPHHLCEYLWKLANQFSDFYNNCRVVGDAAQDRCVWPCMCRSYSQVPCRVWWKGWCAHIDYATACVCVRVCVRARVTTAASYCATRPLSASASAWSCWASTPSSACRVCTCGPIASDAAVVDADCKRRGLLSMVL